MLLSGGVRDVVPVAHPVAGHPHLDVPVALVAAAAFLAVLLVGLGVPVRRDAGSGTADPVPASWDGDLRPAQVVVRAVVVAVLVLAVVAARVGAENELENLAPALLVGAAWPLVFLAVLVVARTWGWVDPWDSLGRLAAPGDRSPAGDDVRPAVVVAVVLLWYLAVHPRSLDPRTLGAVVAAYTVVTVAGCLVRGRRRWLSTAEPIGIVLNTLALARPRRTAVSHPPAGLHALLGFFAGGVLFAALRRTELWTDLAGTTDPQLRTTVGFLLTGAVGAALVVLQAWLTRVLAGTRNGSNARQAVTVAVVPAVAGIVVAVGMARNRLWNSVQLLPGLFGDPFGQGWDLLGRSTAGVDPPPLGAVGLLAAQLTVLVLAHLWGAVLVARLLGRQDRLPAVLLLGQLVAAGVAALSLH